MLCGAVGAEKLGAWLIGFSAPVGAALGWASWRSFGRRGAQGWAWAAARAYAITVWGGVLASVAALTIAGAVSAIMAGAGLQSVLWHFIVTPIFAAFFGLIISATFAFDPAVAAIWMGGAALGQLVMLRLRKGADAGSTEKN